MAEQGEAADGERGRAGDGEDGAAEGAGVAFGAVAGEDDVGADVHEARGELVLGGALANPADEAILLFRGDSPAAAEAFAAADPYVKNGLVTRWRVREWTTVVGRDAEVKLP